MTVVLTIIASVVMLYCFVHAVQEVRFRVRILSRAKAHSDAIKKLQDDIAGYESRFAIQGSHIKDLLDKVRRLERGNVVYNAPVCTCQRTMTDPPLDQLS